MQQHFRFNNMKHDDHAPYLPRLLHLDLSRNTKLQAYVARDMTEETVEEGWLNLVLISDTHMQHRHMPKLPKADILIHSGDFTNEGHLEEFSKFCDYLDQ